MISNFFSARIVIEKKDTILEAKPVRWATKAYQDAKKLYLTAFPKWERFSLLSLLFMSLHKKKLGFMHYMIINSSAALFILLKVMPLFT